MKKRDDSDQVFLPAEVAQDDQTSLGRMISRGMYDVNILDSITSNVIITDEQFKITYLNPAAEKMLGMQIKDVQGKNLFEVKLQGIGLELEKNLRQVFDEGSTFRVKAMQYQSPTYEVRYFDLAYMPLLDKQNKPIGIISIGNDVTKRVGEERKLIEHQHGLEEEMDKEKQDWVSNKTEFENHIENLKALLSESKSEIDLLRFEVEEKYKFHNIIAKNKRMREIINLIPRIADSDSTVLISGETGTGKEMIAKAIHYSSYRHEMRFVGINCAAITETLLESELFGHVKGSFTGAIRDKAGKFELADGGTLFLDEVSEMLPAAQSKILRVLQEKEFERVGGEKTVRVDVRIIAATNRSPEELIAEGKFRQDLFYRLNVIPINLPPLRERMDDVPLLITFFLKKYRDKLKKNVVSISQKALNKMLSYSWPGNVRELENVIEKSVVMSQGKRIDDIDLPVFESRNSFSRLLTDHPLGLQAYLEHCERDYLGEMFRQFHGNIKKISESCGLDRRTIHNKMKKYNLHKEDYKFE